ncbi:MAG: hypothetical protein ACRDPS_21955 [Nocardioides sp.]|uniref:hypothetical protein n=1 Tax=Nocardioides sp. TaxID=35761 RepID=UPI003D6BEA16
MKVQLEAANTTELLAKYADELAAMLDQMVDARKVSSHRLREVRDSLGEMHVELDQVTADLRQSVRDDVRQGVEQIKYVRLVGTAA